MTIHEFDKTRRGAPQGDLMIFRLTDAEAARLAGTELKPATRGVIRLLEGEVTGHHHEIVTGGAASEHAGADEAAALATAELAIARARVAARTGTARLLSDERLAASLPWLRRTDLMIGFLQVTGGPVILRHPEHDAIRLPEGAYYVGRQIESAGAEERMVAD